MRDALTVMKDRFACRAYQSKPIELEKIKAITTAGLQAPSAFNGQPWHIIAIHNQTLIDEINYYVMKLLKEAEEQSNQELIDEPNDKPYYNATAMFLVLKQPQKSKWADIDCGIVVQNMALAATGLGLGNVIVAMAETAFTGPRADEFKQKVKWPDGYEFGVGMLAGYAAQTKEPHEIDESKVTII